MTLKLGSVLTTVWLKLISMISSVEIKYTNYKNEPDCGIIYPERNH